MRRNHRVKWRRKDILLLLERLELYVNAGMNADAAVELCREGISPRLQASLAHVHESVCGGGLLSRALAREVGLPSALASIIEHGETAGSQGEAVGRARLLLEREDELMKKCLSALAYPIVIAVFAALLTLGLIRGVMPQIIPLLTGLHVKLPVLTRVVIWISNNLGRYGLPGILSAGLCAFACRIVTRKSPRWRERVQRAYLHIPVVGHYVRLFALSTFLQSFGTLVEGGQGVAVSFMKSSSTVSLLPLRNALVSRAGELDRGSSPSSILEGIPSLPPYAVPLVRSGELSGTLGASLVRAARLMDRDLEHALKQGVALIEPLMMVGMGGAVGAIALSIMMPIYDISRVLQH